MKFLPVAAFLVSVTVGGCVGSAETRRGGPSAAYDGPMVRFQGDVSPRVSGRAVVTEDGSLKMAWSGTAATIRFEGAAVSAEITDTGDNHYLVLVDGKPKRERINPVSGRSIVELVKGLPRGEHTVTLYRLNEPFVGTSTLHGFILDEYAKALPLASDTRPRILLIGDSISAGYGNLGTDEKCGFSPETEDHFATYGARAARAVDADLTTIAWSGKGVFSNRGSEIDPLPALFPMALPQERIAYDFSDPPPRAIIINLGSNDFAPEVEDTSPFGPAYEKFLGDVRARYPEAHVFLALGPLLSDDYPEGKNAYTTVKQTLTSLVSSREADGDANVSLLEFERPTPEEGWGCDFHPSKKTHDRMAATLVRALKEKAGF